MKHIKYFDLNEGVNDTYLYHATSLFNAHGIVKYNLLKCAKKNFHFEPAISFSRNRDFWYNVLENPIRFVVDRNLLRNNYRLKSFDFFGDAKIKKLNMPHSLKWNKHNGFEYEDIVNKDIKNFMKYVVRVEVSVQSIKMLDEYEYEDSTAYLNELVEQIKGYDKEVVFINGLVDKYVK